MSSAKEKSRDQLLHIFNKGFQEEFEILTMNNYTEKKCPKCGQKLRFPNNIGGMLMACPSCGQKFHSDFRLGKAKNNGPREIVINVFEMPSKILDRIGRYFSS
jgi:DNA-directed RNA polymerase subunit RPC12/RpoP